MGIPFIGSNGVTVAKDSIHQALLSQHRTWTALRIWMTTPLLFFLLFFWSLLAFFAGDRNKEGFV